MIKIFNRRVLAKVSQPYLLKTKNNERISQCLLRYCFRNLSSNKSNNEYTQDEKVEEGQHSEKVIGPDGQLMTKSAYKKLIRKIEKEKIKAEYKKQSIIHNSDICNEEINGVDNASDSCSHLYGERPLIRSEGDPNLRFKNNLISIKELSVEIKDKEVNVRARVHRVTGKGSAAFILLRDQLHTAQACIFVEEGTSKRMVEFCRRIPKESIVEIKGIVHVPDSPIKKCTQQVELLIKEIWVINKSIPRLPFNLDDASNLVVNQEDEENEQESNSNIIKSENSEKKTIIVTQNTRLDNRVLDLRIPTNISIIKLSSAICKYFREYLNNKDFIEIHTPKILGGSSEGGSEVFHLNYFGKPACLAQSPQLFKQMGIVCDLKRVYEIGPVFRAENSNTQRHLCEFTGLDLEMAFDYHYFEVVDEICNLFKYIFENLYKYHSQEIKIVHEQYPSERFIFKSPVPRIQFIEACEMLAKEGYKQNPYKDLETENEKILGNIVKKNYETDFFLVYNYPKDARAFYTMLNPSDENYTNSYDFFMRGQEILSGAQRIHDSDLLKSRAIEKGINPDSIRDYIDCFKYGSSPHAGGGIGLERVLKLFLGIHNIRKCSMFPRDPKRL